MTIYEYLFLICDDAKAVAAPVIAIGKQGSVWSEKADAKFLIVVAGFTQVKVKGMLQAIVEHFLLRP